MPAFLRPAELLALTGPDASPFAHAQFTNDVQSLDVGRWQWNAWLDAQGRVRHFFALLRPESSILIAWLPLGGAEPMRAALARFVLRAAVKLDVRIWTLHALDAGDLATAPEPNGIVAHQGGYALTQPGAPSRLAWIAPLPAQTVDAERLREWQLADVEAGLPFLTPELGGEFVPQALDLERFDAIRFDKGCYPGQEIAARLHFRGGNKRHPRRLRVHGAVPLSAAIVVDANRQPIGQVLHSAATSSTSSLALAVLAQSAMLEGASIEATNASVKEMFEP